MPTERHSSAEDARPTKCDNLSAMSEIQWTNDAVIASWDQVPYDDLAASDPDGDFGRRHLLNPTLFHMLGAVRDARILDAGCGQGYLSRMLAGRGAQVVGVEAARPLYDYAVARERERGDGIRYVRADLSHLPDLGDPFDAVVANMVFLAVPDWKTAMRNCIQVLRPGGALVFSIEHPCWAEDALASWARNGSIEIREYAREHVKAGRHGPNFHRPFSTYLNEAIRLGCRVREVAEPTLDPDVAWSGPAGAEAAVHVPAYLVVAVEREDPPGLVRSRSG